MKQSEPQQFIAIAEFEQIDKNPVYPEDSFTVFIPLLLIVTFFSILYIYNRKKNRRAISPLQIKLIECSSCNRSISARANICPTCGNEQTKECLICKNLILSQASSCPECGDPSPFKPQGNNQEALEVYKSPSSGEKIKSIMIAVPCFVFIALFVRGINDFMEPGFLRLVIILLGFYSTFKVWEFFKNRVS